MIALFVCLKNEVLIVLSLTRIFDVRRLPVLSMTRVFDVRRLPVLSLTCVFDVRRLPVLSLSRVCLKYDAYCVIADTCV